VKACEADGFGFSRRVTENKQVRAALKEFVEYDGPAFLEVMVDTSAHVYPMVGPGLGYKEMITGDYIPSRDPEEDADDGDPTQGPTGYF
jgi:acetolactate synthase-1/2/3 large subunit